MPEDQKPDLVSRIHKALGLKVSPEEYARIDQIKKEGEEQNAALKRSLDFNLASFRRRAEADAAAGHQAAQAALDSANERVKRMPKQLDSVNDMDALMSAHKAGRNIVDVRNETTIYQWDDGYGNILYLSPAIGMDQVHAVSSRITGQREVFGGLGVDEQSKIRAEFGLSKDSAAPKPYKDFLECEARGKRFQELKQRGK